MHAGDLMKVLSHKCVRMIIHKIKKKGGNKMQEMDEAERVDTEG